MKIGRGGNWSELDAGIERQLAGEDFFVAGQQICFEDGFDGPFVGSFGDVPHFAKHILDIAVLEPAQVDDEINFVRAVIHGDLRFVTLGIGIGRAQRKADERDDLDFAFLQQPMRSQFHA